jgi:hypothetical protein
MMNMESETWIEDLIRKGTEIEPINAEEKKLVDKLVNYSFEKANDENPLGILLASMYDLAISAVYYSRMTNSGWIYCDEGEDPSMFLPFVNCCPRHVLKSEFVFHKSNKPTSAVIGQATTRILLLFYQNLMKLNCKEIKVLKANEPADAIFLDIKTGTAFFVEIKSSPLLTLALRMKCETMTDYDKGGSIVEIKHRAVTNSQLYKEDLEIMVP